MDLLFLSEQRARLEIEEEEGFERRLIEEEFWPKLRAQHTHELCFVCKSERLSSVELAEEVIEIERLSKRLFDKLSAKQRAHDHCVSVLGNICAAASRAKMCLDMMGSENVLAMLQGIVEIATSSVPQLPYQSRKLNEIHAEFHAHCDCWCCEDLSAERFEERQLVSRDIAFISVFEDDFRRLNLHTLWFEAQVILVRKQIVLLSDCWDVKETDWARELMQELTELAGVPIEPASKVRVCE